MAWEVRFEREFTAEFKSLSEAVQVQLVAHAEILQEYGPNLGRPFVDTLRGSAFANMKELRFNADGGVWRVAFAFDPRSRAVVFVAGNKSGLWAADEKVFYERLIATAEARFRAYLQRIDRDDAAAPRRKDPAGQKRTIKEREK